MMFSPELQISVNEIDELFSKLPPNKINSLYTLINKPEKFKRKLNNYISIESNE